MGGQRERCDETINEWTGLSIAESLRESKDRQRWSEMIRRSVIAPIRPPEIM